MLKSTLEPSNGGIGIRLKSINDTLIKTSKNRKFVSKLAGPKNGAKIFKTMPKTINPIKLAPGPAREITAMANLGRRKLYEFTGTGLAQPKPIRSIIRKPIGSTWTKGLRLKRPDCLAVSSPK